jgi:hypothetical protein
MLWVSIPLRRGVLDTTLCDKVWQWLSTGTPVSYTCTTDRHDMTEILLDVALSSLNQTKPTSHDRCDISPMLDRFIRALLNLCNQWISQLTFRNCIGGVMVVMFASCIVGCTPGQIKPGICCFSAVTLRRKSKDLVGSQSGCDWSYPLNVRLV